MRVRRFLLTGLEVLLISVAAGGANLFFRENPGFFSGAVNPYIVLAFVIAAYYGKYYGFLSLGLSSLIIAFALPLVLGLFYTPVPLRSYWDNLSQLFLPPLALALVGVFVLGVIRDRYAGLARKARERLTKVSREAGLLKRRARALETVNRGLEERVVRQDDSVTALYSTVQQLYSLNLKKALGVLLDLVEKFSGATKSSIWEYDPEQEEMRIVASLGWDEQEQATTVLPIDGTIEGWVLRNDMLFSVRMLLQYNHLKEIDRGRNLMTLPIKAGRKVWGILNIEDMPFSRYSQYTEKLLLMTVSLAAPALEKAVEYDSVIRQEENAVTGLASFSHFYSLLQKNLDRMLIQRGTLSIIILEITNYGDLSEEFGEQKVLTFVTRMARMLRELCNNKAAVFQYKQNHQVVLLFPNLDFDGASLLCLEILSEIGESSWHLDGRDLFLEAVLGYASLGEDRRTADEMIEIAENLLEMQKV
jgi:GGDEF domain-containing protein